MIKDRLGRHLTALLIAKLIVLVVLWAAFFRAPSDSPPLDPAIHILSLAQRAGHGDRP
jgi:hypothetical protein